MREAPGSPWRCQVQCVGTDRERRFAGLAQMLNEGKGEKAVELYTQASRYPVVADSQWFEDVAGRHVTAVAATLPPGVISAAKERGRAAT